MDESTPSSFDAPLIRALVEANDLLFFVYSPAQRTLLSWSPNIERVLGVPPRDVRRDGSVFLRHVHPDDRFTLLTALEASLSSPTPYRSTYRWLRPDNDEERWLHCRGSLVSEGGERLFHGSIIDISDELRGPTGTFMGPEREASLLSSFPSLVFALDEGLRITRMNRPDAMRSFTFGDPGFSSERFSVGRPFASTLSPSTKSELLLTNLRRVLEGKAASFHERFQSFDKVFTLEVHPTLSEERITGLLAIVSDATNVAELEHKVSDFQRREGLHLLTTGLAHHIESTLHTVTGHTSAILAQPNNYDLVVLNANALLATARLSQDLLRQLLSEPDLHPDIVAPTDLNLVIMAALTRSDDLLRSDRKISLALGTPPLIAAPFQRLATALQEIIRSLTALPTGTHQPIQVSSGCETGTGVTSAFLRLTLPTTRATPTRALPDYRLLADPSGSGAIEACGGELRIDHDPSSGAHTVTLLFPAVSPPTRTSPPLRVSTTSEQSIRPA